jgi:hypothetical protein
MKIAICDDIRIHAEELSGLVSGYYGATAEVSINELVWYLLYVPSHKYTDSSVNSLIALYNAALEIL